MAAHKILDQFTKHPHALVDYSKGSCGLCGDSLPRTAGVGIPSSTQPYNTPRKRNFATEFSHCAEKHLFHTTCMDDYVDTQKRLKDANDNPLTVGCPIKGCSTTLKVPTPRRDPKPPVLTGMPAASPSEPHPRYARQTYYYAPRLESLDSVPEQRKVKTPSPQRTPPKKYLARDIAGAFLQRGGAPQTPPPQPSLAARMCRVFCCGIGQNKRKVSPSETSQN
jgi:hypothetical protein